MQQDLVLVEHAERAEDRDDGDSGSPLQDPDLAREGAFRPGLLQVAGGEDGGYRLIHRRFGSAGFEDDARNARASSTRRIRESMASTRTPL